MRVLFLTTHNLATNPRLVKEIKLALDLGFKIELICFEFDNWSKEINETLKQELKDVTIIPIPAGKKPFAPWLRSVTKETLCRALGKYFTIPISFLAQAVSRRNALLIKHLSKAIKPQIVIGHNPGALWATVVAGKKFECKAGFDVEDYHPGEGHNYHQQQLSKRLMNRCLPLFNYVSFASSLIKDEVAKHVVKQGGNWFTVLNYFPSSEFLDPVDLTGPVKMIWFSQNISNGRGLEIILPYIKKSPHIELHLFGNLHPVFFEQYLSGADNIKIHTPLPQIELHHELANFDIGLALEPAKDRNNELAVSNKLLAYLQAGLYVLGTNTTAQKDMLDALPDHGYCFDHKTKSADEVLNNILSQIDTIRSKRKWRFENFRKQSWEKECRVLKKAWAN